MPPLESGKPRAGSVPATGLVREVIDGDTLVLATGSEVRLVGIQAPKLPLGRPNFPVWPLAPEAKAALEALTQGKTVRLHAGGTRIDRHGRILAQVHLAAPETSGKAGVWIQGEMLRQGLARAYTFRDNRSCSAALLRAEQDARAARRGIWALPYFAIRRADAVPAADTDTFQLVEGMVLAVAERGGRTYLNFGTDWRTDFTASVAPENRALFERDQYDLKALEGRSVRIRGWLESRNGPMMSVTHPEQIERLD